MTDMDRWGPWASGIDDCERRARLRSLRAIVRMHLGPRGAILERGLHCAETGAASLEAVHGVLSRLPSMPLRQILGSYAALTKPTEPCKSEGNTDERQSKCLRIAQDR